MPPPVQCRAHGSTYAQRRSLESCPVSRLVLTPIKSSPLISANVDHVQLHQPSRRTDG